MWLFQLRVSASCVSSSWTAHFAVFNRFIVTIFGNFCFLVCMGALYFIPILLRYIDFTYFIVSYEYILQSHTSCHFNSFFFLFVFRPLRRLAITTTMRIFEIVARNKPVELHLTKFSCCSNTNSSSSAHALLTAATSIFNTSYNVTEILQFSYSNDNNDLFFIRFIISLFLIPSTQLTFSTSQKYLLYVRNSNASNLSIIFFFNFQVSIP